MKDFIFIIGPSAVGKTTLAKGLFDYFGSVYIEQSMVPEFAIPEETDDIGIFEEETCFENTLMQIKWFHKRGFKNIIALDFDDLRVREFPNIFKGYEFVILRLYSSSTSQIRQQMEERHKSGEGLYYLEGIEKSNETIANRPLLPNEIKINVFGKGKGEVLKEAIELIEGYNPVLDYDYQPLPKSCYRSWVQSNRLNEI